MKSFNKLILSVIGVCFSLGALAQTTVPQIISSSETWSPAGSPYIISQNILVKNGATVTVKPGTKIRGTGNFKIIMEEGAAFEAIGNKDSVIVIDTTKFEFMKKSVGYNFSTNSGSQFVYCSFTGMGVSGMQTIYLIETNMLVRNCRFFNTYYSINAQGTSQVNIEKSVFDWKKFDYGYAYYSSGANTTLNMDECIVSNSYGIIMASINTITGCYFYNWQGNLGVATKSTFKCNTFRKFRGSIINCINGNPAKSEVVIVSNTFDSADYHIDYYVMGTPYAKFVCKNNNFLQYNKNSVRIAGGSKPGYADTLVFTKNYWNTTSSAAIKTAIWDIKDDITIGGLVDFANFQTSMNTDCIEDESKEEFVGTEEANGIKSQQLVSLQVYPNPASQFIVLNNSGNQFKAYKIYAYTSQLVASGTITESKQSIDISSLTNGLYILEATDGQLISGSQKFVISK